jgi:hypothetical protein
MAFSALISLSAAQHKLDPAWYKADMWKNVPGNGALNVKTNCAGWYPTQHECEEAGNCKWENNACNYVKPWFGQSWQNYDDFCYSNAAGHQLQDKQCAWQTYWEQEAAKPSTKQTGNCKLVDKPGGGGKIIKCAQADVCKAGLNNVIQKSVETKTASFACNRDCAGITDAGIKHELLQRCCKKCCEVKKHPWGDINSVECLGCPCDGSELQTAHVVNCSWKSANKVNLICQHAAACETGESETTTNKKQMQCKVVACDPECTNDRQMYAACCAACLQNSCAPGNYGPGPVNQICRGCVPPSPPTTTLGPDVTTTGNGCPPCPTCPPPVKCAAVVPRKAIQEEGKSNMSFTLVIGLATVAACTLGAFTLGFSLGKKQRQDVFSSLNVNDGEDGSDPRVQVRRETFQ